MVTPARTARRKTITARDLPFSCPPKGAPAADLHPRVFLQINHQTRETDCPYCGTRYILATGEADADAAR